MKIKNKYRPAAFLICFAVYFIAVVAYATWSNNDHRKATINEIDQKLMLSAKTLKFLLAPDFHDRAIDADAITKAEEMTNRAAVSGLAFDTDMAWLYTLAEKDGRFYFSAPTVSAEEAKEKERWYFLPYDDIPPAFVEAFKRKEAVFEEYTDQWGTFRSVALPETSPGGRTYLACADYEISNLQTILRKNQIVAFITAIYFFVFTLPFVILVRNSYSTYTLELKSINTELTMHKQHLEELVDQRTAELKRANEQLKIEINEKTSAEKQKEKLIHQLQKALSDIKSLSGLLPICVTCKKIRDDQGYWNQLELYIRDHSEADFSHCLCPDCAKKLYPDLDIYQD